MTVSRRGLMLVMQRPFLNCLDREPRVNRREFLQDVIVTSCALLVPGALEAASGEKLEIGETIGKLRTEAGETPIPGATWFITEATGDGLAYRFPAGFLQKARYLTADLLVDENDLMVFELALQEGEHGGRFRLHVGLLPQCSARIRFVLDLIDQRRSVLDREGALLKPAC
jgi:hypothetical protein